MTLLKRFLVPFLTLVLILPFIVINANGIYSPSYRLVADGAEFQIPWHMETGKVSHMEIDKQSNSLTITLVRVQMREDNLLIKLPTKLIFGDNTGAEFTVLVNDNKIDYKEIWKTDRVMQLSIPLSNDATKVQIFATYPASEFGTVNTMVLALTLSGIMLFNARMRREGNIIYTTNT